MKAIVYELSLHLNTVTMAQRSANYEKLGISQRVLAKLLYVSPSLVRMYQQGRRSLPKEALLLMADLESALASIESGKKASMFPRAKIEVVIKHLQDLESRHRYAHEKLGRRAKRMHNNYEAASLGLRVLKKLLATIPVKDQARRAAVKVCVIELEKTIEKNDPLIYLPLFIRVQAELKNADSCRLLIKRLKAGKFKMPRLQSLS